MNAGHDTRGQSPLTSQHARQIRRRGVHLGTGLGLAALAFATMVTLLVPPSPETVLTVARWILAVALAAAAFMTLSPDEGRSALVGAGLIDIALGTANAIAGASVWLLAATCVLLVPIAGLSLSGPNTQSTHE